MHESLSNKALRFALASVVAISLVALLHTTLRASTPAAFELVDNSPRLEGYSASLTGKSQAISVSHYSYGTAYQWELTPEDKAKPAFRMQLMPVHSREWMELSVEQVRRLAALPEVTEHTEIGTDTENEIGDRVIIGHSGSETVLQTCLVPGGRAQVSMTGLNSAVTEKVDSGMHRRIKHFLGLQSNVRWECLLVTISQPSQQANSEFLLHAWRISRTAISSLMRGEKSN